MNMFKTIGFLALALTLFTIMASRLNAQTCGTNGQLNGVFYMVCFSRLSGETTDTERIRRALDAVEVNGGGRLVFSLSQYGNGTYYVNDTITLDNGNSNLIIEGVTKRAVVGVSASTIQLTATGTEGNEKPLFKIDPNVYDVTIRDIGLAASTKTYTTAILAKNTSSNQSSLGFKFSNIIFSNFDIGIHVKSANGITSWQFDNVRLDHCSFEYTNTGIQLDADNTGWNMSSIAFNEVPENGYAMKLIRSGYVSMDLIIGNGTKIQPDPNAEPIDKSETFIYVQRHGNLSIKNSQSEGFKKGLDLDGVDKTFPVYVVNNVFPIRIKNTNVISIGNHYGNFWRVYKPQIIGYSDVISIGDRFCYPLIYPPRTVNYCADSKFELVYGGTTEPNPTLQTMSNQAEVAENLSKAMLKIQNANPNKVLLELGNYNSTEFNYTLKRDGIGWLSFEASQADPYRGFSFNGPVKLPEYTLNMLPVGIAPNGSMVFCSNCQENTNPCQGGGNGALAIVIQGQWRCK